MSMFEDDDVTSKSNHFVTSQFFYLLTKFRNKYFSSVVGVPLTFLALLNLLKGKSRP